MNGASKIENIKSVVADERRKIALANRPEEQAPARSQAQAKRRLESAPRRNQITPTVREQPHSRNLDKALGPSLYTGREMATAADDKVARHYKRLTQAVERVMARKDELKRGQVEGRSQRDRVMAARKAAATRKAKGYR